MKLLALGATGRTGRWVLEYALGAGHDVVALARTPEKILARSPRLSVVRGTPENADDVLPPIRGCEAVISTLDNSRASDLPWARPLSPPMLMARSIGNTLAAMRRSGPRRIVVLSALGVGDSFALAPAVVRLLIRRTNLGIGYDDHEAQEGLLRESGLDWTCVRAAILTNRRSRGKLIVSYDGRPKPALTIGRAEVARFMGWPASFNFNVEKWDAEGLNYETPAICRSLELARAVFKVAVEEKRAARFMI